MTQERVTHWPSMRKCPFCNTFNPDWVTILLDYPEGGASTTIRRPFFFIDESFTDRKISLSNREWIQSIYKNFTYLKIHFHLINRAYSSTFSKFQSHRLQTSLLSIPFPRSQTKSVVSRLSTTRSSRDQRDGDVKGFLRIPCHPQRRLETIHNHPRTRE